jgi:hypothetical protein
MGLDQYAYKVKKGIIKSSIPSEKEIPSKELVEIAYWRKHPNLHGWMERLYDKKGGDGMFNCEFVQLTESDLIKLQEDIVQQSLLEAIGPFWGEDADDMYKDEDLKFIDEALESINKGYDVVYYSWW